MTKIKRYLDIYKVIPPIIVEHDISNPEFKPIIRYKLLNIADGTLFSFVTCTHMLKINHVYYGEVREYGIFWRFTKKKDNLTI